MSRYKPIFKCQENYKEKFKDSKCLLAISVGQEYHEGEKFSATIDLVNKSFKACAILVGDSLQRHTMSLREEKTADELYSAALIAGDDWLARNKSSYSRLSMPTEIVRWDRFLFHEKFAEQKNIVLKEILENENYANSFSETANEFIMRYAKRSKREMKNLETFHKATKDYLVEECTALCLWVELNCFFVVYPARRNEAMRMTHKLFVIKKHSNLLHSVSLRFKNKKRKT